MTTIAPPGTSTRELITEFQDRVGLVPVDAYRSAFCALAYHHGWIPARIGRYLGVSRARVGQRIQKLRQYVESRDDMPVLSELLITRMPDLEGQDLPVGYEQAGWMDNEFAFGLLRQEFG